ncbi:MAG: hypothetical protein OXE02_03370 [Chloroflexi bacterium]|nr:hypothetical protein [Chloroflexota bacterium]
MDALGVAGMTGSPCGALAPTPDWIAVSVGAVERGVTMEVVTPLTPGGWPEAPGLPDAAELLPDDTLGFAALSFNPSVEEWREALGLCTIADLLGEDLWDEVLASIPADDQIALFEEVARMGRDGAAPPAPEPFGYDATLADVLDLALWAMSTLAGFDMESDLLDHLGGGVIVGVLSLDGDLAGAPDVAAMLAYREGSSGALGDTMALLAQRLADDLGLGLDSADVGAEHRALMVELDDPEGGGLAPGYVLHDGYLTFSTTRSALEAVVSRQKGAGDALADDGEYRRTTAHLPGRPDMLTYLNLRRLVGAMSGADLIDRRAGDALEEIMGSAAVSAGSDDRVSRVTFALMLFPEG